MEIQRKSNRVLVFYSREICYLSSDFFAHQIGAAFEELGFEAELCGISKGEDYDRKLEPYLNREYRLILDFNSLLPRMALEDGTHYIDHLNGPFFDWLLDHPLFHYNGLVTGVENLHVLVLDEAQERYVRQYHPNVQSVHTLPLGACESFCSVEKQAGKRVLFLGTYDDPETVYELVRAAPEPFCSAMKDLIERRLADPLLSMEEAFERYLLEHGTELTVQQFALFMNAMYPVDAYLRDYFRKAAIDALLSGGVPVAVTGEGWENYCAPKENLLEREKGVSFGVSFERIAKERILLNVSPMFSHGMHDRIPAGMANRTAVLTDRNPYLESRFRDGDEICFYSLQDLNTLKERAGMLLENEGLWDKLTGQGYQLFLERHTWKHRAEQILKWTDELA